MKKHIIVFIVLGVLIAAPAYADLYGFYSITNTIAGDAAIGEAQLSVDVTDRGANQVLFTFLNSGPLPSSITQVYFDDGVLDDIASIDDSDSGVSFSEGASPGHLPGFNPAFFTDFTAGSDSPVEPNGVNPGESLGILFDILGGNSFANVIDDINSGALRIGIHVQGFASGGSESFVNVPEPATLVLLGVGLIVLAWFGRKSFFKKR